MFGTMYRRLTGNEAAASRHTAESPNHKSGRLGNTAEERTYNPRPNSDEGSGVI